MKKSGLNADEQEITTMQRGGSFILAANTSILFSKKRLILWSKYGNTETFYHGSLAGAYKMNRKQQAIGDAEEKLHWAEYLELS